MKIYKRELAEFGSQDLIYYEVIYNDYDYIKPKFDIKKRSLYGKHTIYVAKTIEEAQAFVNLNGNDLGKSLKNKIQNIIAEVDTQYCDWDRFCECVIQQHRDESNIEKIIKERIKKYSPQELVNMYI